MTSWDRYLILKSLKYIFWINVAIYSVYFCSELIHKFKYFNGHISTITTYYSIRIIPFLIISTPIVAFITQALIIFSIHRRKEWHIAKLLCTSHYKLSRNMVILGLILCVTWSFMREAVLPLVSNYITSTSLKKEPSTYFYEPKESNHIHLLLKHQQQLKPETSLIWSESKNKYNYHKNINKEDLPINSIFFLAEKNHYIYQSVLKLFSFYQNKPSSLLFFCILERILTPLLFLFYFCLSGNAIFRIRRIKRSWVFPSLAFLCFSISIMTLKTNGLKFGTTYLLFQTFLIAFLFYLFYIKTFSRKKLFSILRNNVNSGRS